MTDRNILWRIANSTNLRARQQSNQQNNSTINDAELKRMHYFQQAQATGQRAQFYHQYVLPSQGGQPRNYDFQIAAMEFKIEQEHVNSENQMLAPQQIKENIETKMEISTKNDIIEKINKLVESLTSLLNEQSIATTKIYTVFKEYNNFSQYYNNYVNEIANDVQFRNQFINKIVELEGLFDKLLGEVSQYITLGFTKPDLKVVSMGQVEAILKDIMRTLVLMLDVKPTTPFVNDTTGLAFGQVKTRDGQFREPFEYRLGENVDEQGESKYLETDTVPDIGYTEDEIRDLEEGNITQEELDEKYAHYIELATEYITAYVLQEYDIQNGVRVDDEDIITIEDTNQKLDSLRIGPEKLKQLWHDIHVSVYKKFKGPKKINPLQRKEFRVLIVKLIEGDYEDKDELLEEVEAKRIEYNVSGDEMDVIMDQIHRELKNSNKDKIIEMKTKYLSDINATTDESKKAQIKLVALARAKKLGLTEDDFENLLAKNTRSSERNVNRKILIFNGALKVYFTNVAAAVGNPDAQAALNAELTKGAKDAGLNKEQIQAEFVKVRNELIPKIIQNFITTRNHLEDEDDKQAFTDAFIHMSKNIGYSETALKSLILVHSESHEDGDEGIPYKPKGISTTYSIYGQYLAKISRILKPASSKKITIDNIAQSLFTRDWIAYYNTHYGVDVVDKPLVASLINADMLEAIKEACDIGDIDFNDKCRALILAAKV